MSDDLMTKFEASFSQGDSESTDLSIVLGSHGLYRIESHYIRMHMSGFPATETIERTGGSYAEDAEVLVDKLMLSCRQGWFHHYRQPGYVGNLTYGLGRWSILVEHGERVERWEGLGHAPHGLDNVYEDLASFGMSRLKLGHLGMGSFEGLCGPEGAPGASPWHLTFYRKVLKAALVAHGGKRGSDDDVSPETADLLFDEFLDDMTLYLVQACPEALSADGSLLPQAYADFESICATDVRAFSRKDLHLLFGALVRSTPTHDELKRLVQKGVFDRWCDRLDEIPREEHEAMRREEFARRVAVRDQIDASVRRLAHEKKPFTSYDVAKDCGVTAQKASGRIRTLVNRGEIKPIEGSMPRKYLAA